MMYELGQLLIKLESKNAVGVVFSENYVSTSGQFDAAAAVSRTVVDRGDL